MAAMAPRLGGSSRRRDHGNGLRVTITPRGSGATRLLSRIARDGLVHGHGFEATSSGCSKVAGISSIWALLKGHTTAKARPMTLSTGTKPPPGSPI